MGRNVSRGKQREVQRRVYKKAISEKHIVNNILYSLMFFEHRTGVLKHTRNNLIDFFFSGVKFFLYLLYYLANTSRCLTNIYFIKSGEIQCCAIPESSQTYGIKF